MHQLLRERTLLKQNSKQRNRSIVINKEHWTVLSMRLLLMVMRKTSQTAKSQLEAIANVLFFGEAEVYSQ